jgi:RNA polymerase sigma-B factor
MAGDLERVIFIAHKCAAVLKKLGTHNTYPLICSDLAKKIKLLKDTDDISQAICTALSATVNDILNIQQTAIIQQLSSDTDISAIDLKCTAGLISALQFDGHKVTSLGGIQSLPGTLIVLSVIQIQEINIAIQNIQNGSFASELTCLWKTVKVSGNTFDGVIIGENSDSLISQIGWDLIRLESVKHVNLVWHQVNKLTRSYHDTEPGDLLTWGWLGLRTALRYYNPRLGFAFSTYACTRIVGSIRDGIRAESPVPKRLQALTRRASLVEVELTQTLGRIPTLKEVGLAADLEIQQLDLIKRTRQSASLDEMASTLEGRTSHMWMLDSTDVEEVVIGQLDKEYIAQALDKLIPDDAAVIRLLILEGVSTADACTLLGTTARQLRKCRDRGIAALRLDLESMYTTSK